MLHKISKVNLLVLLLMSLLVSGCTTYIIPTKFMGASDMKKGRSLVYGFYDVSEVGFNIKEARIFKVTIEDGERKYETIDMRTADDGFFYIENLEPGNYEFGYIVGTGGNALYNWHIPDGITNKEFKSAIITIKEPGLYYVGSYKSYKMYDGGMFGEDFFQTRSEILPDEKTILKRVLKHTEGDGWDVLIKNKLKKLG